MTQVSGTYKLDLTLTLFRLEGGTFDARTSFD